MDSLLKVNCPYSELFWKGTGSIGVWLLDVSLLSMKTPVFFWGGCFWYYPPAPQPPQRKTTTFHWNKAIPKQKHNLPSSNIHTFFLFRTCLLRFSVCFSCHCMTFIVTSYKLQPTYIPFFLAPKKLLKKKQPPSRSLLGGSSQLVRG